MRILHDLWSDRAELTSWPVGAGKRSGPIPILVGGSSGAAMRRAARLGDGGTRSTCCRRSSRMPSPTTVCSALADRPAHLDANAAAGADELVISGTEVGAGEADVLRRWERFAEAIERAT
jgi:hypothetical protein